MTATRDADATTHILTFTIEEYFQVGAFNAVIPRSHWHRFDSRVERNTHAALQLLADTNNQATFFTSGWIADHYPQLLQEVVQQGHEVACQNYYPSPIKEFTPSSFKDDVSRAKEAIEQACGLQVQGFRIGQQRLTAQDLWALECLATLGFAYDSSFCPLGKDFSQQATAAELHQHQTAKGPIWEAPISSHKFMGLYLPIAGGNYIRQLPWALIKQLFENWIKQHQPPLVSYFHVWEIDKNQPFIDAAPWLQRLRHYRNLDTMGERIRYILEQHNFTSIAKHLALEPAKVETPKAPEQRPTPAIEAEPTTAEKIPLTIATPCYNEEATLSYLHKTLYQFEARFGHLYELNFLFVDDGSRDQTWQKLTDLFAKDERCLLIKHPENRGIAAAILTAIENAPTELVTILDADCTFDPMQLPELMEMMSPNIDLVAASPLHPLGKMTNVPGWRLLMSKGAAFLYRLVLHHKFASYTSCFRIYRRSKVLPMPLLDTGFCGVTEILARMDLRGSRIAECPAVLEVRLLGQSKINTLRTILDHLQLVWRIAMARLLRRSLPGQDYVPVKQ